MKDSQVLKFKHVDVEVQKNMLALSWLLEFNQPKKTAYMKQLCSLFFL